MSLSEQEIVVQSGPLKELARELCIKAGIPTDHAQLIADLQVETDLRGVHSHGTRALPRYLRSIFNGDLIADPEIKIVEEGPSYTVIDGGNGIGHPSCVYGMSNAIEKAKKTGIAATGVRNSGHYGAAACYTMMAVEQKMIGFATTNTGGASVAAPGGAAPVVANNALSYGFPAGSKQPILLDMACAVASWGKVETLRMYGEPIPPGWLLDSEGLPVTVPSDVGRMLAPAAGARGYGLALAMGTLAGPLVGGLLACHKESGDKNPSEHFFIAINVGSFTDYDEYVSEVENGIDTIQKSRTAPDNDQVFLPGEIEWDNRQKSIKEGIPLHIDHLRALSEVAAQLDVDIPWLRLEK